MSHYWLARACVFAIGAALAAAPVSAEVLDLSPSGELSVRTGSGEAVWHSLDSSPTITTDNLRSAGADATLADAVIANQVPQQYSTMFQEAAAQAGLSPSLLAALVWQESRWNAAAVSPKGAIGLTQLMPATASGLGVNPRDPAANLLGGARYLRQLLDQFDGDLERALAAYNAGPERVRRANGIPQIRETRQYVSAIIGRLWATRTGEMQ
jgi:soluble lytic murein transglycosylase-like protein